MMLTFLETGRALYVLTAVCVLGLLSRWTARGLYKRLIRETDNMTMTKNRWLRDFRQKAENAYRLNQGIQNTQAYLEKQLFGCRFLGLSLNGWSNLSGQLTILCFLLGGAAAFGSYWYRCDSYYIVLYGTVGLLTGLLTLFADCGINLPERRSQLLAALQDYLENSLFRRLARETAAAAKESVRDAGGSGDIVSERQERRQGRLARKAQIKAQIKELPAETPKEKEAPRRDVEYLKQSLEQIAASREKNRGEGDWIRELSPDELELVGEILKQYLA